MTLKLVLALTFAAVLGACSQLTADAPLFTPADQQGPPPIAEGVWIVVSTDCPDANIHRRRVAAKCYPMEIGHRADGYWTLQMRPDLIRLSSDESDDDLPKGNGQFVLVPAAAPSSSDDVATLYFAESQGKDSKEVSYAALAPLEDAPATKAFLLPGIWCDGVVRDGPIDGVESEDGPPRPPGESKDEKDEPVAKYIGGPKCKATTRAGVREAVRRAVIQYLPLMYAYRMVRIQAGKTKR